ncbi:MAG: DUF4145 domain-containing protein [Actinobacteria bacterium]|jgi:hypothetical protein|uniref:DUF4145 domain-containing protein n=1 Tax=Nostocoides veronense TaxID=330836 RepID=A0ABN2M405_9MICO|nr:DUF4145 domain-containing protein [Actinomycetota bacterium]MCI1261788.1 DUF4145 domain-containing protein [Tetrasphaera jenkinsii]
MPVGVEAFVDWVSLDEWPNPTCPKCLHGHLVGKEGLTKIESGQSERWRGDENWDPDWIYGALAGVLRCNNSECGETVAVAGSWRVGDARSPYEQYDEQLFVKYFDPPLHMMNVPDGTPESTKGAIEDASRLLLINPSASANRLRQGIESLMDAKKVKKTRYSTPKNGKRKRVRLTLHGRIDSYRAQEPEIADLLEAVKWIGNDGSHESDLKADEVLIGARILEVALRRLFETHGAALDRQVREIIKRKGVRKR